MESRAWPRSTSTPARDRSFSSSRASNNRKGRSMEIKAKVDASGLSCPLPILKASQAVKTVESGELVEVIATDPGSVKDFAAWATSTGNALVESGALPVEVAQ